MYSANQRRHYLYLALSILFTAVLGILVYGLYTDQYRNIFGSGEEKRSATGGIRRPPILHPAEKVIAQNVPFTSQAPFSEWGKLLYQEGCEEAVTIMAVAWATGKTAISQEEANAQIIEISEYEEKTFGTHIHISVYDIGKVMKDHLGFQDWKIEEHLSKAELIKILQDGKIAMVPAAGRELKNIFYTPPGPLNHMILLIGYDEAKKEFITNDSGTKNGDSYRYPEDVIYRAIGYYPTSATDAESIINKAKKPAIVIHK